MHRYFSSSKNVLGDKIIISDGEQVHHIKDVLWLEVGEEVMVFDEKQNEYRCFIAEISKKEIILSITERPSRQQQKKVSLTLACAIPKQSKLDDIIDKLTQLGVDKLIPLETERVVVRLDAKNKLARLARWKKIALSAAKQSQRNSLLVVEPVKNMEEALAESKNYDLKLIGSLFGKRERLKVILSRHKPDSIIFFIGPEGDFSEEELRLAEKFGFIGVSLGDLVLRVDTAAISVASFISLYENS